MAKAIQRDWDVYDFDWGDISIPWFPYDSGLLNLPIPDSKMGGVGYGILRLHIRSPHI